MFSSANCTSNVLPGEYQNAAEALFPAEGHEEGNGPSVDTASAFAETLGIGEDFKKLLSVYQSEKTLGEFLEHFQNNLDLLIQKTWVEKAEEERKEELQDKVPPLIALIEQGNYSNALEEFGAILEELAYLFFGAQSQRDDFAKYVLRIDPLFGLFWWYAGQINREKNWVKNVDQKVLYAMLLLGICYLTDF